jgi:hypothetical protein
MLVCIEAHRTPWGWNVSHVGTGNGRKVALKATSRFCCAQTVLQHVLTTYFLIHRGTADVNERPTTKMSHFFNLRMGSSNSSTVGRNSMHSGISSCIFEIHSGRAWQQTYHASSDFAKKITSTEIRVCSHVQNQAQCRREPKTSAARPDSSVTFAPLFASVSPSASAPSTRICESAEGSAALPGTCWCSPRFTPARLFFLPCVMIYKTMHSSMIPQSSSSMSLGSWGTARICPRRTGTSYGEKGNKKNFIFGRIWSVRNPFLWPPDSIECHIF